MKIDADETARAIHEWFSDTIKSTPSLAPELGRFFFGVSATTIGTLIAFEKLDTTSQVSLWLGIALAFQAISLFIALALVLPVRTSIEKQQNLLAHYSSQIQKLTRFSWLWFIIWFLGLVVGIYQALFL